MRPLVLFSCVLLVGCDKPVAPAQAPVKPTLSAYHALYTEFGEQADLATSHVYSHKPGLVLDDLAGPSARADLVAQLEKWQPQIQQIITLSRQDPGPIPAESAEPSSDTWPRAWLNRCAAVVQADAGRLWEAGQADDSAKRLSALIRIGAVMMRDSGELMQMWGLARAGAGVIRVNAMIDDGLLDKVAPDTRSELAAAVSSITVTDQHLQKFDKLSAQVQSEAGRLIPRLQR